MAVDDLQPYGLCGQADRVTKIRVREKRQDGKIVLVVIIRAWRYNRK